MVVSYKSNYKLYYKRKEEDGCIEKKWLKELETKKRGKNLVLEI